MRDCEIMLDVHGTRVIVNWPEKVHLGPNSSDEEEDLPSPSKKQRAMMRHSTPPSPSPVQTRRKPLSPVSPTPVASARLASSPPFNPARQELTAVEIYEDPATSEDKENVAAPGDPSQPTQILSQNLASFNSHGSVQPVDEFLDDNDEENDPIVHSFGPFGANLQARMASISASEGPVQTTPPPAVSESHSAPVSPSQPKSATKRNNFDVKSHVINQLAYSRLSSTPLSTILGNLPVDAGSVTKYDLRSMIAETDCIGEVRREGKDAHGKPLESEYYYVPDKDNDEFRREAVVNDLRKPGLRACRKQHKVSLT